MNNTNIKQRIILCGGMVHATITISADWEMPEIYIPKAESWHELNRGKLSKRARR